MRKVKSSFDGIVPALRKQPVKYYEVMAPVALRMALENLHRFADPDGRPLQLKTGKYHGKNGNRKSLRR